MSTVLAGIDSLPLTIGDVVQCLLGDPFATGFREHFIHITNKANPPASGIKEKFSSPLNAISEPAKDA